MNNQVPFKNALFAYPVYTRRDKQLKQLCRLAFFGTFSIGMVFKKIPDSTGSEIKSLTVRLDAKKSNTNKALPLQETFD